ncbi:MAG TPA: DUF1549 and DUF1553 domain-containing protein [Verrucomicrobiae bacterium]|nr:DUF1549 and DUF1553 domain-containing protein [Verrucomicrobiae bacterium]
MPYPQPSPSTADLFQVAAPGYHPFSPRTRRPLRILISCCILISQPWINQGAAAPAKETAGTPAHWAFIPPVRPVVPHLPPPPPPPPSADARLGTSNQPNQPTIIAPVNPIDAFIRARLEQEHLAPSPEADRLTLVRRVALDLTGLPLPPAAVTLVLNDSRPDAYERLVDRLLASPHYGERWGRHWLDVARYADSNGYSIDAPRSVWKYRDWVIQALNSDLPYDQFVIEQLAGDLLPNATLDQQIATGFQRNTQINQEGGIDPEQFRVESIIDRVNTTGTAFLGLTVGCAQCHDHKFDPISQRDYYRLFAFFNSSIEDGHGKSAPEGMLEVPGVFVAEDALAKDIAEAQGDLGRYLDNKGSLVTEWENTLTPSQREQLPPEARSALGLLWPQRTTAQKRAAYSVFSPEDRDFKARVNRLAKLEKREPKPVTTLVMKEQAQPRDTFVFIKGDFTRPSERVTPGVIEALHPLSRAGNGAPSARAGATALNAVLLEHQTTNESASAGSSRLTRLDLARWLVSSENPLLARVAVNRVWQQYFGRGLVETENDFGTQGTPPSHPELLDWLACELMKPSCASASSSVPVGAWSLKHLHRLIVTSATYRQSSRIRPDLAAADPNNRWLGRQARLRLDAEIVRDVGLAASGLLAPKIGGPSVFPPQPDGVMRLGQLKRDWNVSTGADRYRRGLYTHLWRATPYPGHSVFDAPDAFSTCTRRIRSNTPLQALTLLNDEVFVEFARALAGRVLREGPSSDPGRLELAFRLCLGRLPSANESKRLLELLAAELNHLPEPSDSTSPGDRRAPAAPDSRLAGAWTTIARVLLNLDETITRE